MVFNTIFTNSTQNLITSGNVGIGTTLPVSKLHINGPIKIGFIGFSAQAGATNALFNNVEVNTTNGGVNTAYSVIFFNIGNCYSASTGRFTPTVAGYYIIMATMKGSTSTSTLRQSTLRLNATTNSNGTEIGRCWHSGGSGADTTMVVSTVYYMNGSTDYVSIWGQANGPYIDGGSTFYAYLLSQ